MAPKDPAIEERVLTQLSSLRYHRVFHLPPHSSSNRTKPLRVTYGDFGREPAATPEEEARLPTLWFCGGMMAGRWLGAAVDAVLKREGIRMILIDRPGMGGTDNVPVDQRLDVYLEIVTALLTHLSIKHITLACNSCGILYALHLLLHHREILHPKHPYLAVFAPWVHQSHTSTIISATDFLPARAIGNLHNIIKFTNKRVAPVLGWSSGMVAKVMPSDDKPVPEPAKAGVDGKGYGEDDAVVPMTEDEKKEEVVRWQTIMPFVFAEDIGGASDDALLLLKRTGVAQPWGSWGDIDNAVVLLAAQEAGIERPSGGKPLRIEAFYAESDRMIGERGAKWFGQCFEEGKRGVIEFEGRTWPGTDHDGILNRRFGLLERWCRGVKRMYEDD